MSISPIDVVPIAPGCAHLSESGGPVRAFAEEYITGNSDSSVVLIDAECLDHSHCVDREHINLLLIDDANRGLNDVIIGHTEEADSALAAIQRARTVATLATTYVKKHG
jgi:hypothetical protein